ncbi:MAG: Outer-membrane lipoprotein carrier protein [uncultured Campylobacterales bacterium]|uniref:Outer-membrane lipoprotein carrier protein n=1 Tax=uncultured Campylobacterales bacterium TaxID=352960 RepID=A0A6S6SJ80_9BACT|nr:MAG: Outer-membrane lipoprotein carrier protein [uncultured Campylobacterales bacterium]
MRIIILISFLTCFLSASLFEISSLKSDFTQSIIEPNGNKIEYTGTLYIRDDKTVLWDYKSPIKKSIHIRDDKIIIIEPELEQVLFRKFSKQPNFLKLFKNAKKVSKNTYQTLFMEVEYFITVKNKSISSVSYSDKLSNKITINFTNQTINEAIDPQIFHYQIPPHYDII